MNKRIYQRCWCRRPENKAKRRAYLSKPEVKARVKTYKHRYFKIWRNKPGVKEHLYRYRSRPKYKHRRKLFRLALEIEAAEGISRKETLRKWNVNVT